MPYEYTNIPSAPVTFKEGNLDSIVNSSQPKILVLGTSVSGLTDTNWHVGSPSAAVKEFGSEGSLIKGMYEVLSQGANNVFLRRLPTGTPAVLSHLGDLDGTVAGLTITTVQEDAEAGDRYSIWLDVSEPRLAIYDNEKDEWIYDTAEILAEDLGEISVSGSLVANCVSVDIGTQDAPVALSEVVALVLAEDASSEIVFVAGTDGEKPSFMQLYEALHEVYKELEMSSMDFVVPLEATLDAPNLVDLSEDDVDDRGLASVTDYPTKGSDQDVLGKVFIQTYQGTDYFWWDVDGDGVAEIFPAVGSAGASANIDGDAISSEDFHEVNFAYQAAIACYKATSTFKDMIAFVGVEKPEAFNLAAQAVWIGELPTYTEQADGSLTVDASGDNGTGLLGNKFLAGRSDFRSGKKGGGFIFTDNGFVDGTEQTDSEGNDIDIGKHLFISPLWVTISTAYINPSKASKTASPYVTSLAALVASKYATLADNIEANGYNGLLSSVKLNPMKIPMSKLNELLSVRFICARNENELGVILAGSKSAATPNSDWTKISSIRVANRFVKAIRSMYLAEAGTAMNTIKNKALKNNIESYLAGQASIQMCSKPTVSLTATPSEMQLGILNCDISFIPPNSLERLNVSVALKPTE